MTQDSIHITLVIYGMLVGAGLLHIVSTLTNKVKQLNCKYLHDRLAKQVSANLLLKEQNTKLNDQKHYLVTDRELLHKQVNSLTNTVKSVESDYLILKKKYKEEQSKVAEMIERIQSQTRYHK